MLCALGEGPWMTLVRAGGPASAKPHLPAARAERGRLQSKLQARDARFPLATILSWSLLRQVSVIRQVFPWDRTAHRETAVCGGDIRRSAVRPGPTAPRSPAPAGSPAAVTSSQREPHPRGVRSSLPPGRPSQPRPSQALPSQSSPSQVPQPAHTPGTKAGALTACSQTSAPARPASLPSGVPFGSGERCL